MSRLILILATEARPPEETPDTHLPGLINCVAGLA